MRIQSSPMRTSGLSEVLGSLVKVPLKSAAVKGETSVVSRRKAEWSMPLKSAAVSGETSVVSHGKAKWSVPLPVWGGCGR